MTHSTFGGKPVRHKAGMRRGSTQDAQQGRHRIGIFAALGAVAVGALVLAGAVTGSLWPDAAVETAQAEPEATEAAQPLMSQKPASEASFVEDEPIQKTQSPAKSVPANAEAARVAGGKSDSLSPDERINRAVDRITAGSTDEELKKAITVAARQKADELDRTGDTVITAALPESSAYAPAQESIRRDDAGALDAIRSVDKSDEAASGHEAKAKATEKVPAEDSKPAVAATPTGPLGPATVSTAVRLRAGMANNSAVVATVPASAQVQASLSCQSWCEVVYDGHHGYIYKSFIRRAEQAATLAPSAPDKTAAAGSESGTGAGILTQSGSANELAEAAARAQQRNR